MMNRVSYWEKLERARKLWQELCTILAIGGKTISTANTFTSISDVVYFTISSKSNLDNGAYEVAKDLSITLTDAGGFITKATAVTVFTYLHI